MATQWTAGTTSGQVLTAATLNTIGAVWETWTNGTSLAIDVSSFATTANVTYLDSTTQVVGVGSGGAGFAASIGSTTYVWAAGDLIRFFLCYEAA